MARKITLSRLKRRNRRFYIRYSIALVFFALILTAACGVVRDILTEYEAAQPEHAAEEAAEMFLNRDYSALYAWEDAEYLAGADAAEYAAFMEENIGNMEITWKKKITADKNTVTYAVYADGQRFGSFVLSPSGTSRYGFTTYSLSHAETTIFVPAPVVEPVSGDVRIRCDSRSTVAVNGQTLGAEYVVESDLPTDAEGHMPKGVTAPTDVIYQITVEEGARIDVTDHKGQAQTLTLTDGTYVAAVNYEDEAMKEARESWIFDLAQVFSRYTTKDASIQELLGRVENKSTAHAYFSQYNRDYIKPHTGYEFRSMESRNYISYSDTCFSCEIQYEYIVHYYEGDKVYESAYRFYFRKVDSRWLLYDFETLKYE